MHYLAEQPEPWAPHMSWSAPASTDTVGWAGRANPILLPLPLLVRPSTGVEGAADTHTHTTPNVFKMQGGVGFYLEPRRGP